MLMMRSVQASISCLSPWVCPVFEGEGVPVYVIPAQSLRFCPQDTGDSLDYRAETPTQTHTVYPGNACVCGEQVEGRHICSDGTKTSPLH